MKKKSLSILFIALASLFSTNSKLHAISLISEFTYPVGKSCGEIKTVIQSLQKAQHNIKVEAPSPNEGQTIFDLRQARDKAKARYIVEKGLIEIADNYHDAEEKLLDSSTVLETINNLKESKLATESMIAVQEAMDLFLKSENKPGSSDKFAGLEDASNYFSRPEFQRTITNFRGNPIRTTKSPLRMFQVLQDKCKNGNVDSGDLQVCKIFDKTNDTPILRSVATIALSNNNKIKNLIRDFSEVYSISTDLPADERALVLKGYVDTLKSNSETLSSLRSEYDALAEFEVGLLSITDNEAKQDISTCFKAQLRDPSNSCDTIASRLKEGLNKLREQNIAALRNRFEGSFDEDELAKAFLSTEEENNKAVDDNIKAIKERAQFAQFKKNHIENELKLLARNGYLFDGNESQFGDVKKETIDELGLYDKYFPNLPDCRAGDTITADIIKCANAVKEQAEIEGTKESAEAKFIAAENAFKDAIEQNSPIYDQYYNLEELKKYHIGWAQSECTQSNEGLSINDETESCQQIPSSTNLFSFIDASGKVLANLALSTPAVLDDSTQALGRFTRACGKVKELIPENIKSQVAQTCQRASNQAQSIARIDRREAKYEKREREDRNYDRTTALFPVAALGVANLGNTYFSNSLRYPPGALDFEVFRGQQIKARYSFDSQYFSFVQNYRLNCTVNESCAGPYPLFGVPATNTSVGSLSEFNPTGGNTTAFTF